MTETTEELLKPSEVAKRGLIVNSKGKPDYRFVIKLIKDGKLRAVAWTKQTYVDGSRDQYLVPISAIDEYKKNLMGSVQ